MFSCINLCGSPLALCLCAYYATVYNYVYCNVCYPLHTQCFNAHNSDGDGGIADYPLCAAEMVADMLAAKNTETCFRRGVCVCVCVLRVCVCVCVCALTSYTCCSPGNLLTLLVNGLELCDPLGDKNVWGSIFNLTEERLDKGAIMLATKVRLVSIMRASYKSVPCLCTVHIQSHSPIHKYRNNGEL